LPDGLAIFLSRPANLERSQPAIFVSAIRARHLIVIIFSLGRSLRFAQNNRGFVEKLSQPLPKKWFRGRSFATPGTQVWRHVRRTGYQACVPSR